MIEQKQGIYEFHTFQLDIGKGLLLRENQAVNLQWKTFELLCMLVKSNGKLLTRDELIDELWADTFVEDNNLSQHVRALRKALGENGSDGKKFIETVAGRGYRFLPAVRIVEEPDKNAALNGRRRRQAAIAEDTLHNASSAPLTVIQPTSVSETFGNQVRTNIIAFPAPENPSEPASKPDAVGEDELPAQSEVKPNKNNRTVITRRRRGFRRGLKCLLWGLGIGFVFLILLQILQIANMMLFGTRNNLSKEVLTTSMSVVSMLAFPIFGGWFFGIGLFLFGIARLTFALFEKENSKLNSALFEKVTALIITALIAAVVIPNLIASRRAAIEFQESEMNKSGRNQINSIAVLPLKALSSNADDEELRLRITDALITKLGGLKDVATRPTDSVLRFSKSEQSAQEIGKKLQVDAVLDGRIQSEGERVRVTLQLVSVSTGEQIWSEQFDGQTNRILNLQDEISAKVLQTLNRNRQQTIAFSARPTQNAEAYEAYLKGRYFMRQMNVKESLYKAVDYYKQAIEFDPQFAEGYGGLAGAQFRLYSGGFDTTPENIGQAKENLQKALSINPDSVEALTTLGNIQMLLDWDWSGAEKTFKQIVETAPNSVGARIYYGVLLTHLRRFDEAQSQLEQAVKLDPTYAGAISNLGMVYYCKKDFPKAEEQFRKALEFDEKWTFAHMMMWNCLWMQGKKTESVKYIVSSFDSGGGKMLARRVEERAAASEPDEIIRFIIGDLTSGPMPPNPYSLAIWTMAVGDEKEALDWLEKAYEQHLPWTIAISAMPNFEPLHDEPRFQEILRKMNLN